MYPSRNKQFFKQENPPIEHVNGSSRRLMSEVLIGIFVLLGVLIVFLIISNHAQAGDYGVEIQHNTPSDGIGNVTPGVDYGYFVNITNTGINNTGEDINLTVELDAYSIMTGWTVTPSGTTIVPNLQMGAENKTGELITVRAPGDARYEDTAVVNITVDVIGHKGEVGCLDSIQLRANVIQVFDVLSTTPQIIKTSDPGENVPYDIRITNKGNGNDTFSFSALGPELGAWSVPDVTLEPDEQVYVYYNISIDPGHNTSDILITLNVTSTGDLSGLTYDTLDIIIWVNPVYDVQLSIQGSSTKSGKPGDNVDFDIIVMNEGTMNDSFNLQIKQVIPPAGEPSADPNLWYSNTIISPSSIIDLGPGMTSPVDIFVQPIPQDLEKIPIGQYKILIEVASTNDPDVKANVTLTVIVGQVYAAEIEQNTQTKDVDVGESVEYSITITNVGNYRDELTVEILSGDPLIPGSENWGKLYHTGTGQSGMVITGIWLNASESTTIILNITVPEDSLDDTVTLTLEVSPSDIAGATDQVDVTADMNIIYDFEFTYISRKLEADPDSFVNFTLKIKNTGTGEDTFTPAVDEWVHADWSTINPPNPEFSPTSLTLLAGEQGQITMTVYTPAVDEGTIALAGFYNITIRVDSDDGEDSKTHTFIVDLQPMYMVDLNVPGAISKPVDVGDNVTFQFTITNDGNEADTFTFDIWDEDTSSTTGYGDQSGWASITLLSDPQTEISSIYLEAGETRTLILTISVPNLVDPSFAKVLTLDITVIATSEQDNTATDQFTTSTTINPIYSFTLSAVDTTKEGFAGDTLQFTLKIKNKGTAQDTYNFDVIEYDSNVFSLDPNPPPSITGLVVDATDQSVFDVDITSDRDHAQVGIYTIKIMAISENDALVTLNITLTIEITGPIYDFTLDSTSPQNTKEADAGDQVTFILRVRNTGTDADSYNFSVTSVDDTIFTVQPISPISNLLEDSSGTTNVIIDVDSEIDVGTYEIEITAESYNDGAIIKTINLTLDLVVPIYNFTYTSINHDLSGEPGEELEFMLEVINTGESTKGSATDSYDFFVSSIDNSKFDTNPISSIYNLDKGESGVTYLTINIVNDTKEALAGSYQVEVQASSQKNPGLDRTLILNVTILPTANVTISAEITNKSGVPGESIDYYIKIKNKGNTQDTFNLMRGGESADWGIIIDAVDYNPISQVTLDPHASMYVILRVTIPTNSEEPTEVDKNYTLSLEATSTLEDVSAEINVTVTVEGYVGLSLEVIGDSFINFDPNESQPRFWFRVSNDGHINEPTISVHLNNVSTTWDLPMIDPIEPLDQGEVTTFSITFNISSDEAEGEYEMWVYVTSSDGQVDSNHVFFTVNIVKPDLSISNSDISGLSDVSYLKSKVGETIVISARVNNEGHTSAEMVNVTLYIDRNVHSTKTVSSIPPNDYRDVEFGWIVVAEEVEIEVEVTPIVEINQDNNAISPILLDLRPDLSFEGERLNFSNSNPSPKENITISAFVFNSGGDAEDIIVTFYEDTNIIGTDILNIDHGEIGVAECDLEVPDRPGVSIFIKTIITHTGARGDGEDTIKSLKIADQVVTGGPQLDLIGQLVATENETFSYTFTTVGIEPGDTLTFTDDSDLFNIDSETGKITFIPSIDDVGAHIVNITVTDDKERTDRISVTFVVLEAIDEPVFDDNLNITPIGHLVATEEETFSYTVTTTGVDPDDILSFSDDSDLFNIDSTTGRITFIPTANNVGVHIVNITVTDNKERTDQISVTFTILEAEGKTSTMKDKDEPSFDFQWILLIITVGVIAFLVGYLINKKGKEKLPEDAEDHSEPEGKETEMGQEEVHDEKKVEERITESLPQEGEETEGLKKAPPPPPKGEFVEFEITGEESE